MAEEQKGIVIDDDEIESEDPTSMPTDAPTVFFSLKCMSLYNIFIIFR